MSFDKYCPRRPFIDENSQSPHDSRFVQLTPLPQKLQDLKIEKFAQRKLEFIKPPINSQMYDSRNAADKFSFD